MTGSVFRLRLPRLFWLASLLVVLATSQVALADEPPAREPPAKPTSFGSATPDAPLPEVKPGDFEGLLRNCDIERARAVNAQKLAELNTTNVPFLVAAYLALWAILLAYFIIVAVRQKRMRAEMVVLRDRLARLGDNAP